MPRIAPVSDLGHNDSGLEKAAVCSPADQGHGVGDSRGRKRYDAIDGLKTFACIGIVIMHMKANNTYNIPGFIYDYIITSFTNFVFLFMVLSAFGMCCGYLDKMLHNQVSLESFYAKRYSKILPFFTFLVLLDIVISPSRAALIEGIADVTLTFGFFPNNICVIGVGWFLGLIFVFYLIFPFYCVLIKSRRRAWIAFIVSILLNLLFHPYFGIERTNIVYCLPYLIAGGLVYLYRNELEQFSEKYQWAALGSIGVCVLLDYATGGNTITMLLVSVTLLVYALGNRGRLLHNRFTKFFSSISMEVYLSHMVVFRGIEKLHLNTMFGDGWLQYAVTSLLTLCGTVAFSFIVKTGLEKGIELYSQKCRRSR